MRHIVLLLMLTFAAFGQTTPTRVPPDEAAKHLIKKPAPNYPQLAEAAHIQGNVIIEISIDESGSASARRLVSGHPLLAPSAIENIGRWKYQPFDVNGKPAPVITLAMVNFGNPGASHNAEDHAEVLFQHDFWTAEESAQGSLGKAEYAQAEQQLTKAQDVLSLVTNGPRHMPERWQWTIAMGQLRAGQQKYGDAEQYFKTALTLRETDDKDSPEAARTLAYLGNLYAEEKQYFLARENATHSVTIFQKNFKKVGSGNTSARQSYGRAIAYQSWMLSTLALQQNNKMEAAKQCRVVLDFQSFLSANDHDSFLATCQRAIANPTVSN